MFVYEPWGKMTQARSLSPINVQGQSCLMNRFLIYRSYFRFGYLPALYRHILDMLQAVKVL